MMNKQFIRAISFVVIIAAAVFYVAVQVKSKPESQRQNVQYPAKTVEIITVKRLPFRARSVAYGNVVPAISLNAKAEVSGKISYIHPFLKRGGSITKGTVVLRIEPETFEYSVDSNTAALDSNESSLKQLEIEEKTTRRSLKIAKENLRVGQLELDRILSLWESRLIARSSIDEEKQQVLQLEQSVEDFQGKLATYTSRKNVAKAIIKQSKIKITESKVTLGRTVVSLPFDARIGAVSVEKGEFTAIGNVLFEAFSVDKVEITAQLPSQQFEPLLTGLFGRSFDLQDMNTFQADISKMNLDVEVSLVRSHKKNPIWHGKLERINSSVDITRDTIGLVVTLDNPNKDIVAGSRPPLLKGMFTAVKFTAPPQNMLVIPRKALHQGRVYIANEEEKLEIRHVKILFMQGELVVIESGITENEQLIISSVIPVMNGLPLKIIRATEFENKLARNSLGADKSNHKGDIK